VEFGGDIVQSSKFRVQGDFHGRETLEEFNLNNPGIHPGDQK
jgi:hypothetical protein